MVVDALGWRVPVSRSQLGGTAAHGAPSDAAAVRGLAKSQWQVDAAWCLLFVLRVPNPCGAFGLDEPDDDPLLDVSLSVDTRPDPRVLATEAPIGNLQA